MKKLLLIIFLLIPALGFSQKDSFGNFDEMIGKNVRLYELEVITKVNKKYLYWYLGDKLKPIKSTDDIVRRISSLTFACEGKEIIKGKTYLKLNTNFCPFYILLDSDKPTHIENFRNISYWEDYLQKLKEEKAYRVNSKGKRVNEIYTKIDWLSFDIPESWGGDVTFHAEMDNTPKSYSKGVLEKLSPKLFASQQEYNQKHREEEIADSVLELKAKYFDSIPLPARVLAEQKYGKESYQRIEVGDTVYVYASLPDGKLKAMHCDLELVFDSRMLHISDDEHLNYIVSRGEKGEEPRKELAEKCSIECENRNVERGFAELDEALEELRQVEKTRKQKKLFMVGWKRKFGDYGEVGVEAEIYNCFSKNIKYVVFTCAPYNRVGDVQPDWVGKRSAQVRGIGPVEPGRNASWEWEDIFYDKFDVIDEIRPTGVKFIFTDGTSQSFNGFKTLLNH